MKAPYIPSEAPFSRDQKQWLSGFLAGWHSNAIMQQQLAPEAAVTPLETRPIHILYGTQTGNAENLANDAAALAKSRGLSPTVMELDAVSMEALAAMKTLIVVVSTYGEGEMPDNAQIFWETLSASTAPGLEQLSYAVLALGDTSYDEFCQAGKLLDTRLEQLGAKRLGERIDCDVDFEDVAASWLETTVPSSHQVSSETAVVTPDDTAALSKKTAWNRKNPYPATVLTNRLLSGPKSAKEIRHFEFALGDSGLVYEAGDALGVMPVNAPHLVQAFLDRLGQDFDTQVSGRDAALGDLLSRCFEIVTPSRDLLRAVEGFARHDELSRLLANNDKQALENFLWGKDTLDLLNLNPDAQIDPDDFISWLKPLQHRAYSISSSPKAHPGDVHLTVAAVRWINNDRVHQGVASTFLADQTQAGSLAGVFISPNRNFRIPGDNSVPMIMVGPGTGIAPFRAFLEERREIGATGLNWLFFGDQHRESDFIYEDEISIMSSTGLLSRLDLAFSRDQTRKVYVQHRMAENGKDLFAALQEGGHFYVCGDATRMAKDVDTALHTLVAKHGSLGRDQAIEYVNDLKRDKRYVRDVY